MSHRRSECPSSIKSPSTHTTEESNQAQMHWETVILPVRDSAESTLHAVPFLLGPPQKASPAWKLTLSPGVQCFPVPMVSFRQTTIISCM